MARGNRILTTMEPIACSLQPAELSDRTAWMRKLGRSLIAIDAGGGRARLRFAPDKYGELEEFVRAESDCCGFFEFGLADRDGAAELSISAPADAAWAVRGLVGGFAAGWAELY